MQHKASLFKTDNVSFTAHEKQTMSGGLDYELLDAGSMHELWSYFKHTNNNFNIKTITRQTV